MTFQERSSEFKSTTHCETQIVTFQYYSLVPLLNVLRLPAVFRILTPLAFLDFPPGILSSFPFCYTEQFISSQSTSKKVQTHTHHGLSRTDLAYNGTHSLWKELGFRSQQLTACFLWPTKGNALFSRVNQNEEWPMLRTL